MHIHMFILTAENWRQLISGDTFSDSNRHPSTDSFTQLLPTHFLTSETIQCKCFQDPSGQDLKQVYLISWKDEQSETQLN